MSTFSHDTFRNIYTEWREKNPSRLPKAVLRSMDRAFRFFKEICDFPYGEISAEMFNLIIEKYCSPTTRKNMRFLADSIDKYLRETVSQDFRHGEFTDTQAVWLTLY